MKIVLASTPSAQAVIVANRCGYQEDEPTVQSALFQHTRNKAKADKTMYSDMCIHDMRAGIRRGRT
jgi:hypothetical protein